MNRRGMFAAADAVFDAERALRRAADTVDELGDLAASSLRVLDQAATDAFSADQEERRDFYLESASEHLARLRVRSGAMNELGEDLARHLTTASRAIEQAGYELGRSTDVDHRDGEVQALRTQIEVLGQVVALAHPVADQSTRHAQHAAAANDCNDRADAARLPRARRGAGSEPGRRGRVRHAFGHRTRPDACPHLSRPHRVTQLRRQPPTSSVERTAGPVRPRDLGRHIAKEGTPAMGDRTPLEVVIYSCPPENVGQVLDVFEEFNLGHEYVLPGDREPTAAASHRLATLELGRGYIHAETLVGTSIQVAKALPQDAAWRVWEDPAYQHLGQLVLNHPDLGEYVADCDAQGRPIFSSAEVDRLFGAAAGDRVQLGHLTGRTWEMALEHLGAANSGIVLHRDTPRPRPRSRPPR